MGRWVLVVLTLALGLAAGPTAADQVLSPAKYAAGERCEVAMQDGRTVIGGLPASRAAWNGDDIEALRAFNAVLDRAQKGKRTCDLALDDADGRDDFAERTRLRAAWSTYMTEVDRALSLITRNEVAR